MSSTFHTTVSHSNVQLIIDALAEYSSQTGIDLSQNPFSEKFQQSNTPDAILELLQEREKAFKEYRNGNRRLINCLNPTVRILHVFSGLLGEATSLVSHSCLIPFRVSALMLQYNSFRSPSHLQRPSLSALMFSSPYVPSTQISASSHLIYEFYRLPLASVQAMMPFSISSNAWAVSSNALTFTFTFHPPQ